MQAQRPPLLEVKRNFELKTTLVKASSRPPLSGSRLKRGPDQMKEALEPAKKRTRGLGAVTKIDTSRSKGPLLSSLSQPQGPTAAQKGPKKTGPRGCTAVGSVLKNQKLAPTAPAQKPVRKRPGKRPDWDLKGQLCDLTEELKCYREKTQKLDQENQGLQEQLKEAQEQAAALGTERNTLEGELASVRTQAEQCQQKLEALCARVLELEEWLGTKENLIQELQKEQLELQEERKALATRLEEQERRLQASEAALLSNESEVVCLRQKTAAQVTLLAEQGDRLHGLEMERRRLHNQLQELKGNIRVFCRVRPVLAGEPTPSPGFLLFPHGPAGPSDPPTRLSLSRSDDRRSTLTRAPAPTTRHDFSFDRVFPPGSKQEEVFEEISMLVQSALDGYPVCIFAYGQTGSGKTFTMEGRPGGDPQLEGLIPRAMRHLFSVAQEMSGQGWTYSFVASYVEIYNETVRDLLATGTRKGQGECEIRRARPGSEELTVTNARYVPVSCEREVEALLHLAHQNRAVARTAQNERSSRSHSVFQLQISGEHAARGLQCVAPLNLVDLAGSERLDPGLTLGPGERDRLRETQSINSSLSTLGLVIMALSNKESHVPYRNSKLTYLLQNSLGGSAKIEAMGFSLLGSHLAVLQRGCCTHSCHTGPGVSPSALDPHPLPLPAHRLELRFPAARCPLAGCGHVTGWVLALPPWLARSPALARSLACPPGREERSRTGLPRQEVWLSAQVQRPGGAARAQKGGATGSVNGEGGAACGGGAWSGHGGGAANGCGMGRGWALTCRLAASRVISCRSRGEPPVRKGGCRGPLVLPGRPRPQPCGALGACRGPSQDAMAQLPRLSRLGAPSLWDPASPAPTSGPRPRLWEGQDVLARWTDGLLYLGTIKKVDSAREVCLVQFEDDSQFLVLWKDISPAALPGEELLCCVCRSETVVPGNRLVSCEKCRHAYHQDCHVPRAPAPGEGEGTSWVCRQCVFAIATKRGGALKKGPYARAMLGMKLCLPYGLKGLDWDAGHLSNRQQSYCYCGGPGE
ncbi:kinesin family member C5B [Cricetulus griseus]